MNSIIKYLTGYLVIEITGEFPEQILNLTVRNRILMWNLQKTKNKLIACISVSDFKKIRKIKRGTNQKIKIIKKRGFPFKTVRYKNRFGLVLGAVIFFTILNFMSRIIWNVEVEGNSKIKSEEIITACDDLGIKIGVFSKEIKPEYMAQKLLLNEPRLAWAAFNIEGCKITAEVTEIEDKSNDTSKPTNLKSNFNAVIEKIDVTSGDVLVKAGDTVYAGDLLVSGIIDKMDSTIFVKSKGTIIGKTNREFKVKGSLNEKIKTPSKHSKKRYLLSVFNLKLPLYVGTVKGDNTTKSKKNTLVVFGEKLPITLYEKDFYINEIKTVKHTKEELIRKLEKKITNDISKIKGNYTVISTDIWEENNEITLIKRVEAHENIAISEDLLFNTTN